MSRYAYLLTFILLLVNIVCLSPACASSPIDPVLTAEQAPPGVVFEIATGKSDSLNWALPQIKTYIAQIRQRFPEIPIAIVTHGREMFALQNNKRNTATPVHQLTQELVRDGVNLHVCGTYAGYKGLSEEDFPEYVNVAAAGPAQINDYVAVGYLRIEIKPTRK